MRVSELKELSGVLGEGFFADNVLREKDFDRASAYAKGVLLGREIMNKTKPFADSSVDNVLANLHKFNRFMDWLMKTYGRTPCKNYEEAEQFLLAKIDAIGKDTADFKSFWGYIQEVTLCEGNKFFY